MNKKKKEQTRIALQLPRDMDQFFAKEAIERMLSKSALIRSVLNVYWQSRQAR